MNKRQHLERIIGLLMPLRDSVESLGDELNGIRNDPAALNELHAALIAAKHEYLTESDENEE